MKQNHLDKYIHTVLLDLGLIKLTKQSIVLFQVGIQCLKPTGSSNNTYTMYYYRKKYYGYNWVTDF